jgi:hypothetical protein
MAAGLPAGTPFDRRINGGVVDVSAHNGFVETYLRFGIPGFLALTFAGLFLWLRRRLVAQGAGIPEAAVLLLLLSQFVFSIGYSLDAVQGVIAGILVSGLAFAPSWERAKGTPPLTLSRPVRLGHP